MKTFSINTLGCKVNQYESQQIRELLENLGLQMAESSDSAIGGDLVVINTCCVTHTASAKSRQLIRKARKHNPDAVIVISGCLPSIEAGELDVDDLPQPDCIHLVRDRADLSATLTHITGSKAAPSVSQRAQDCPAKSIKPKNSDKIKHKTSSMQDSRSNMPDDYQVSRIENNDYSDLPTLKSFKGQTRAFLKVQDGCDGYCTYCIVPKTRPFVRSKPVEKILQEAETLIKSGHKEIVVTGIFLGAYGMESVRRKTWPDRQNDKLAELLDKMAKIPGMGRIRLSSLEPADVTERLLDILCEHENIMPHLHLPLQSGSDSILKKMCRQYRVAQFKETVNQLKALLDRPAITTDIIVGFPGETDTDFQHTVNLAKDVGFAKMHVFAFSPRAQTAAGEMKDQVDNRTIRLRSKTLRDLDIELGLKYREQFIGDTAEILLETDNSLHSGRCERYFMVSIKKADQKLKKNQMVKVLLLENNCEGMLGTAL